MSVLHTAGSSPHDGFIPRKNCRITLDGQYKILKTGGPSSEKQEMYPRQVGPWLFLIYIRIEVKLQESHEFTSSNRCFYNHDKLLTKMVKTRQEKKVTMFRIQEEWRKRWWSDRELVITSTADFTAMWSMVEAEFEWV